MEHTVGTDYYHRGRINLRREGEREEGTESAEEEEEEEELQSRLTNASLGVGGRRANERRKDRRSGEPRIMAPLRQVERGNAENNLCLGL